MTYVLDTNTLIYYFKGLGRVASRLLSAAPSEIAVSTISLYELEVGIAKSSQSSKRRKQLLQLESVITVLGFGREEAGAAARIRARLERSGQPIGPLDNLIAGTAVAHNATLVTHNIAEFQRVPGLTIVDWY